MVGILYFLLHLKPYLCLYCLLENDDPRPKTPPSIDWGSLKNACCSMQHFHRCLQAGLEVSWKTYSLSTPWQNMNENSKKMSLVVKGCSDIFTRASMTQLPMKNGCCSLQCFHRCLQANLKVSWRHIHSLQPDKYEWKIEEIAFTWL